MARSRSLSQCGLVLLSLLSCHRVPATLAQTESAEPAGRDKVFVESSPRREGGLLDPLSNEAIALYTCWFESPYEYMFGYVGEPLVIDDRSFGMLMAGSHGILFYGALNECAGRMVGQPPAT